MYSWVSVTTWSLFWMSWTIAGNAAAASRSRSSLAAEGEGGGGSSSVVNATCSTASMRWQKCAASLWAVVVYFFLFLIPLLLPLLQSPSQYASQSALNRSHNFNGCGEFVALLSGSVASFMDPDRHPSARAELLFLCVCSGVNEVNKLFVYFCFLHKKKATNITKYWRNAELMGTASSGVTVRLVSFGVSLPVALSWSRCFSVSCCLLTSPNWQGKHTHTHTTYTIAHTQSLVCGIVNRSTTY